MLRGGHDAMTDHQLTSRNAMLYYNVPFGWWNVSYTYSQSEYRSQIPANGFNFKQTGDSPTHQLRVERVIHRDALRKTSLNTGLASLRSAGRRVGKGGGRKGRTRWAQEQQKKNN